MQNKNSMQDFIHSTCFFYAFMQLIYIIMKAFHFRNSLIVAQFLFRMIIIELQFQIKIIIVEQQFLIFAQFSEPCSILNVMIIRSTNYQNI
jgi:hypothetical protein